SDACGGFCVKARHFLMRFLVNNERSRLTFTASAGGGGNRNKRHHWLYGFADAPIILHYAAVRQNEVAAFRGVHRAAAAKPDDGVNVCRFGGSDATFDTFSGGVFARLIKDSDVEMSGLEKFTNAI